MNLFSLFRSSTAEIMFSKRWVAIMYGVLAAAILTEMVLGNLQFFNAYYTLHEFDVPADAFIISTLLLLFPFWVVGALMARACVQRARLALWVRKAFKSARYNTPLKPAQAGFLVDYEYSHRELAATLIDLHFRKLITLRVGSFVEITVTNQTTPADVFSAYERTLLANLQNSSVQKFHGFNDMRLVALALPAHETLIEELTLRHFIDRERLPTPNTRRFFRVLYIIAGFMSLVYVNTLVTNSEVLFTILYPRYPVTVGQIVTLVFTTLLIAGILATSFWPKFVQDYKDPRYQAWIDAAGFMLYLRAVYTHRFSVGSIATQDWNTLRDYTPYAIAYGIIPPTPDRVAQLLNLESNKSV